MKARAKATGVVVEVQECDPIHKGMGYDYVSVHNGYVYKAEDLEIEFDPDYWEKLKHQYAGMAMQGMLSNAIGFDEVRKQVVESGIDNLITLIAGAAAADYATALVRNLKEEK